MKKTFTKFLAALALLAFFIPSMIAVGQTTTTETVSLSDGSYADNQITWTCGDDNITIAQIKGSSNTAVNSNYVSAPRVYKGHILSFTGSNNYKITKIEITYATTYTGNSMTAGTAISNNVVTNNTTDVSRTWATASGGTHIVESVSGSGLSAIHIQNVASGTNVQLRPTEIKITYIAPASGTPTIALSESAFTLGQVPTGEQISRTFSVTQSSLTSNISLTATIGTVTPNSITKGASATTVTWTYTPTTDGVINGTITASSTGATTQSISISGTAYTPLSGDHYEKISATQSDWSGYYIFTGIGNGDYYALTGVAKSGNNTLGTTATVTAVGDRQIESNTTTDSYRVHVVKTTGNNYSLYIDNVGYLYYSGSSNELFASADYTASTCEWTLSYDNNVVTITNVGNTARILQFNYNNGNPRFACYTSSQVKLNLFKYTGTVVVTPSINANNVSILYNATSGSIAYTIDNEPTPVGTLTAAIVEGGTIANLSLGTIANNAVPFNCNANSTATAHTATVTLTYTYDTDKTVTKDVTITQAANPNVVDNISDITGTNQQHTVRGTVVAVNNKGYILGDGTGYIYIYLNATPEVSVGDKKKVSGTTGNYNHVIQYTSSATIEAATESNYNNTPAVQELDATAISAYSNDLHLSDYVQIQGTLVKSTSNNTTYYNIQVANLNNTASISYPTSTQATVLDALDNKTIKVKGYFAGVSSGHFNVVMESVEEVVVTTPTIVVNPLTLYSFSYVAGEGPSIARTITVSGSHLTHNITLGSTQGNDSAFEWSQSANSGYSNSITLNKDNSGTVESTTIYVRMKADLGANSYNDVLQITSEDATSITINLSGVVSVPSTWDLSIDQTATATDEEMTWTCAFANMGVTKGNASTATNNYYPGTPDHNYTSTRFYKNSNFTLAPVSGYALTSAIFIATSESYANAFAGSTWTNASASVSGTTVTITPIDKTQAMSAIIGGTCGFTAVTVNYGYPLAITGYGTSEGGYVLIASPVTEDITPSTENGFFTSETSEYFDLYRYNPTATGAEWENWKQTGSHNHFAIETGRGYLYASKTNTQLSFTGTLNTATDVELAYTGYNLIGNSSNAIRYISGSYYIMNSDGTDIILSTRANNYVEAMEGIVVNGTAGATVTFSTNAKRAENSRVILNIVNSRGNVIDRAIVSFDENGNMPKFMIDETNTKIYFPQSEGNYAIVSSNGQGTMPVNFKAKEIGQYTISVETEGIDLGYLHLIDRLTGDDINLLLDSKYSFVATNSDIESRFILSFSENGINANNETFAFQNGSDIIVNGEGELQIFDVTGRMVKNTVINGIETITMPQGVYIFRLNENIQKIVVR